MKNAFVISVAKVKFSRTFFTLLKTFIFSIPLGFVVWILSSLTLEVFWQDVKLVLLIVFSGAFFIMSCHYFHDALKTPARIERNLAELYAHYPELEHNLGKLNTADYIDTKMMTLVYGHHIIAYHSLEILNLAEHAEITYVYEKAGIRGSQFRLSHTEIVARSYKGKSHFIAPCYFKYYKPDKQCRLLLRFLGQRFELHVSYPSTKNHKGESYN